MSGNGRGGREERGEIEGEWRRIICGCVCTSTSCVCTSTNLARWWGLMSAERRWKGRWVLGGGGRHGTKMMDHMEVRVLYTEREREKKHEISKPVSGRTKRL